MAKSASEHPMLLWTDAAHASLVGQVAGLLADRDLASLGGPRKGDLTELAESLVIESVDDDLRQMVLNAGAGDLLLATQAGVKLDDIQLALESGINVLTLEPITIQADRVIVDDRQKPGVGRLAQTPMFRRSPGYRAAAEPQEALGRIRSASLSSIGMPGVMSLVARMVDALDMVIALLGVPITIDAALTGPLVQPPEDLRGLTGHLSMNLHFADNAAATVQLSDRASVHRRALTVVADEGTLLLDDDRYRLYTAEGETLDETETDPNRHAEPPELIAHQWRHLGAVVPSSNDPDPRVVLGCCEAALLSTRTGQSEATETLVRMKL
jgi:hypothetical protein